MCTISRALCMHHSAGMLSHRSRRVRTWLQTYFAKTQMRQAFLRERAIMMHNNVVVVGQYEVCRVCVCMCMCDDARTHVYAGCIERRRTRTAAHRRADSAHVDTNATNRTARGGIVVVGDLVHIAQSHRHASARPRAASEHCVTQQRLQCATGARRALSQV
jgi:hypothetical protein